MFENISHGITNCTIIHMIKLLLLLGLFGIIKIMLSLETSTEIMFPLLTMLFIRIIIQGCITKRLSCFYTTVIRQVLINARGTEG